LCREIEARWGKRFHPASLSRVVRRLGFSRQKARPSGILCGAVLIR
jgi:transposase